MTRGPGAAWGRIAWSRGFNSGGGSIRRRGGVGGGCGGGRGGGGGGGGGGNGSGGTDDPSRALHRCATRCTSRAGSSASGGDSAPGSSSLFRSALTSYAALNNAHPTAAKVGTSVVILIFGDASAQRMQHQQRRTSGEDGDRASHPIRSGDFTVDWRRLGAFASFGAIYTGWFQMHWFRALQTWFPKPAGAAAAGVRFLSKPVLGPLLLNQFVMVPAAYYPFYFGWTGLVRGFTTEETVGAMKEKYKPQLLLQNWAFWLPAQSVQFALIPSSYHILYVSAMGLAWNTILSLTTLSSKVQGAPKPISQSPTPTA